MQIFHWLSHVLRIVLGGVLLFSGWIHLQNTPKHFISIASYRILSPVVSSWLAVILPPLHCVLGIALMVGHIRRAASMLACALFFVYATAQVLVMFNGISADCGCFGGSHSDPIGFATITRTSLFAGMSMYVFSFSGRHSVHSRRLPATKINSRWVSRGVTLMELVVVLAILGLLICLLFPAITAARERARSLQCVSQSRQLVLAAIAHEAAMRHFPSNGWGLRWVGMQDRGFGAAQPGGWLFSIQPFLDGNRYYFSAPSTSSTINSGDFEKYVMDLPPVMRCPTRASPDVCNADPSIVYHYAAPIFRFARFDYAVNSGDVFYVNGNGPDSLDDAHYSWPNMLDANGMAFVRSEIRSRDVVDGLSNVLYCGEKWISSIQRDISEPGTNQPYPSGDTHDVRRFTFSPPVRDDSKTGDMLSFGAAHSSGCVMSFSDGSVHFISFSIHPLTFQRLGNRRDGDTVEFE